MAAGGALLVTILRWAGPHGPIPVKLLIAAALVLSVNGLGALPSIRFAFLWRNTVGFGALFGFVIGAKYMLDAFWPTGNYVDRSVDVSVAVVWIAFFAGFWGAWVSARVRTGTLLAMVASTMGWVMSVVVAAFIGIVQSPATLIGALTSDDEVLGLSLILIAVAAVLGTIGAMLGKGFRTLVPHRTRLARPV
jgi:hypothetical protein